MRHMETSYSEENPFKGVRITLKKIYDIYELHYP